MVEPLIILCPLRSFSSVACGMLGQHPEMYGFPELHLFVVDSMEELMLYHERKGRAKGGPGLLRSLAQLHDGIQTETTIHKAKQWLDERQDWSTKKIFDYLLEQINPKIGIEKTPVTVMKSEFIERAYTMFPKSKFLHLTRHPISAGKSMQDFFEQMSKISVRESSKTLDPARLWFQTHSRIIEFTSTLPLGQSMRLKGEDLLSNPDLYLPQIAEWLGVRTDKEAIEAMKHPEVSSYASIGPRGARGGNDPKFLKSPVLRVGQVSEPSLTKSLEWALDLGFSTKITKLAKQMGYQ